MTANINKTIIKYKYERSILSLKLLPWMREPLRRSLTFTWKCVNEDSAKNMDVRRRTYNVFGVIILKRASSPTTFNVTNRIGKSKAIREVICLNLLRALSLVSKLAPFLFLFIHLMYCPVATSLKVWLAWINYTFLNIFANTLLRSRYRWLQDTIYGYLNFPPRGELYPI